MKTCRLLRGLVRRTLFLLSIAAPISSASSIPGTCCVQYCFCAREGAAISTSYFSSYYCISRVLQCRWKCYTAQFKQCRMTGSVKCRRIRLWVEVAWLTRQRRPLLMPLWYLPRMNKASLIPPKPQNSTFVITALVLVHRKSPQSMSMLFFSGLPRSSLILQKMAL